MKRGSRRTVAVVAGAVLVGGGALGYAIDRHFAPRPIGHVAMPPAGATPRQVVIGYLAALNANDPRVARALTKPGSEARAQADSWLRDLDHISDIRIHGVFSDPDPRYHGAVDVVVDWNVDWRHSDGSTDGDMSFWDYSLASDPATGRWLIFDQGQG